MKKNKKRLGITKVLGIFMVAISTIGLLSILAMEDPKHPFLQSIYMISILAGGLFSVAESEKWTMEAMACLFYFLASVFSLINGSVINRTVSGDTYLMLAAFFISVLRCSRLYKSTTNIRANSVIAGKYSGQGIIQCGRNSIAVMLSMLKKVILSPETVKVCRDVSTRKSIISLFDKHIVEVTYSDGETSTLCVTNSIYSKLKNSFPGKFLSYECDDIHTLLMTIRLNTDIINEINVVTIFVKYYDEIIQSLQKLVSMGVEPKEMSEPPILALGRLEDEFQWHLCDAIERAKKHSIGEIKGKYRNSVEFQKREAAHFEYTINEIRDRCSPDTANFANDAVIEVLNSAGLPLPNVLPDDVQITKDEENWHQEHSGLSPIEYELARIDCMEGHAFERWCADLLRKNGFTNVEVTKGSGDQGVDVLAVKDGIRYAVQCKCYSSDLGNKPVQEVHAGKAMYHCQVGAVMTNRRFTPGAKQLAEATGVLLWDRDKLEEMLRAAQ